MDLPMFYDEAEEWSRTILIYDAALREISTKLEILNNEFKLAHQYNPIEHIKSRVKSPQSIAKKIRHNGKELTVENIVKYINDVAGIRVICSFTSDIYRISELIAKQNDVKVLKVKDYIKFPKPNGYTSYHMIVSVPIFLSDEVIETKVEIQIRTIAMDFWASLEHKMYYKFEGNAPEHIRKELKECADVVSFLDQKMLAINEEIKIYSKDPLENYKEMMAALLSDEVKECYGTVVEEENEHILSDECGESRTHLGGYESDGRDKLAAAEVVVKLKEEKVAVSENQDTAFEKIEKENEVFIVSAEHVGDDIVSLLESKINQGDSNQEKVSSDTILPSSDEVKEVRDKVAFTGSFFGKKKQKEWKTGANPC